MCQTQRRLPAQFSGCLSFTELARIIVLCPAYDAHVCRSRFGVVMYTVEMQLTTANVTENLLCNACLWLGAVDCVTADTLACRWLPNLQQHVQCVLAHGHRVLMMMRSQQDPLDECHGILHTHYTFLITDATLQMYAICIVLAAWPLVATSSSFMPLSSYCRYDTSASLHWRIHGPSHVTTEKAVNFLQWQRYSGPNGCLCYYVSAELVVQNASLRLHSAQSFEEVVSTWKLVTGKSWWLVANVKFASGVIRTRSFRWWTGIRAGSCLAIFLQCIRPQLLCTGRV